MQTNEHLLHELNDVRRRHDDELRQLQLLTAGSQHKRNAVGS